MLWPKHKGRVDEATRSLTFRVIVLVPSYHTGTMIEQRDTALPHSVITVIPLYSK